MSAIRLIDTSHLDAKSASIIELRDSEGLWWVYYTIGADLSAHIQRYADKGYTVGDTPELTTMVTRALPPEGPWDTGVPAKPYHRRAIIGRDKGPAADQAIAETEAENEYPRAGKDDPISYIRDDEGQLWLVYQRGPHLRSVIDELWKQGKAVCELEITIMTTFVTDDDPNNPPRILDVPMMFRGRKCFKRRILPRDLGCNPGLL